MSVLVGTNTFNCPNDYLFRYGGDEFLLLSLSYSISELELRLNELYQAIATLKIENPSSPVDNYLTLSCGGAYVDGNSSNIHYDRLFNLADGALYKVKARDRNGFSIDFIWFLFGGVFMGLLWWFFGLLAFITIVGIPWGRACFVLGNFSFFPFGYEAISRDELTQESDIGTGPLGMIGNIIWFLFAGIWLAIGHITSAVACFITIIGIPFAIQHLKLAQISLAPIGKR